MAYATRSDIVELYSDEALYVADRDGDGVADDAAITRALESASAEIDSHLGVRYPLPLLEPPGVLKQYCVDIALYRLASARDMQSEEHRRRYEDALAALRNIATGKAVLVFPGGADGDDDPDTRPEPRPVFAEGPERLFTRDKMEGL